MQRRYLTLIIIPLIFFSQIAWSMARPPLEQSSNLRYGWQEVGTEKSRQVSLKNTASSDGMRIDSIDLPQGFSHDLNVPTTIAAGDSITFNVSVTGGQTATLSGYMKINWTNDADGYSGMLPSPVSSTLVSQSYHENRRWKWQAAKRFADTFPLYDPRGMAVSDGSNPQVYVVDEANRLMVYDLEPITGQLVRKQTLRSHQGKGDLYGANDVALAAGGSRVLVLTRYAVEIYERDGQTGELTYLTDLRHGGRGFAASPDGDTVIVAAGSELDRLSVSPTGVVAHEETVALSQGLYCANVALTNSQAFVSCSNDNQVEIYNADENSMSAVQSLTDGGLADLEHPEDVVVINDQTPQLLVASEYGGSVAVFIEDSQNADQWTFDTNLNNNRTGISDISAPNLLAMAPSGETLFVAGDNRITALSRTPSSGAYTQSGTSTNSSDPYGSANDAMIATTVNTNVDGAVLASRKSHGLIPVDDQASVNYRWQPTGQPPEWAYNPLDMEFTPDDRFLTASNNGIALYGQPGDGYPALLDVLDESMTDVAVLGPGKYIGAGSNKAVIFSYSNQKLSVDKTINLSGQIDPDKVAPHPSGNAAAVISQQGDRLLLLQYDSGQWQTGTLFENGNNITNMEGPSDAIFSPDGDNLYVIARFSESIKVLNYGGSGLATSAEVVNGSGVSGMSGPAHVAISNDGGRLFVGGPSYTREFTRANDGSLSSNGELGTKLGISAEANSGLSTDDNGGLWIFGLNNGMKRLKHSGSSWQVDSTTDYSDPGLGAMSNIAMAATSDSGQYAVAYDDESQGTFVFSRPAPATSTGSGGGGGGGGGGSLPSLLLGSIMLLILRRR